MWLMDVMWESLNFGVLASVALICLPSETSRMLTYASQLPTSDDEDIEGMDQFALMMAEDDELEAMDEATHGRGRGGEVEMPRRRLDAGTGPGSGSGSAGGGASSQAEKHRRIVEAAQRRRQGQGQASPDHYSLPDSLGKAIKPPAITYYNC
jgi:hypothetical protein